MDEMVIGRVSRSIEWEVSERRSLKNQAMFSGKVHRAALYTRASVIVPLKAAVERAQLVE